MSTDRWNSRLGAILAVAGSAVGLGNFLRFPGQAAEYGGGAFMLAYAISFLIIGLPICWAEWTMGRYAGRFGFHSAPGIFNILTRRPAFKYVGVIGIVIPVVIYMYYVYIEAWCLGYAVSFLRGEMDFASAGASKAYWVDFVGMKADGDGMSFGAGSAGFFLLICFALNFILIYRGIAKGIEWFCRYAMPALVILAIIILIRVLTLGTPDPSKPEQSVWNGLGFMWNPTKVMVYENVSDDPLIPEWVEHGEFVGAFDEAGAYIETLGPGQYRARELSPWYQLQRPQLWLAAAGQIFFSLSVGFGIILTYSSYLRENDDVVLSGLAATGANEFCEVGLGGMITLPAGVAFLGAAGLAGMGTFGLGFVALPMVFANMWGGALFGFLFFFLLFLAAVTSSLSMLQPGIAFLQGATGMGKKQAIGVLGLITAVGSAFVMYFSADVKALDSLDFWVGNFLIYVLATIQIVIFAWVIGIERGFEEAHRGSAIRIPAFFGFLMKFVTPVFLLTIFLLWLLYDVFGVLGGGELSSYIKDLFVEPNRVAWLSLMLILGLTAFFTILIHNSKRYRFALSGEPEEDGRER